METMKRALLVIDMLNDFVNEDAPLCVPDNAKIIPALEAEISAAREREEPVLYLCDAHALDDPEFAQWPPHAVRGTTGAQVVEPLTPRVGDEVVHKTTFSCFYNTRLDKVLAVLEIDTVRLTGCVTNICILYAAYEARLRSLEVEVMQACVAGLDPGEHRFSLNQMKTVLGAKIL